MYIVKYTAHTIDLKIVYKKNGSGFIAYADADWASDQITRISVTGYVLMLAEGAVLWVSRKQKTIALSSTEAEYMSMLDASRQLIWVQNLYQELGYELSGIDLCGDNQGAIFLASNPAQEHRSKHIDIRYHYICEQVENKRVCLFYVPTNKQIAYLMTKNLPYDKLKFFRNALGISDNNFTPRETKCTSKMKNLDELDVFELIKALPNINDLTDYLDKIGDKDYTEYVLKQREVTLFMDPLLKGLENEYKIKELIEDLIFYDSGDLI